MNIQALTPPVLIKDHWVQFQLLAKDAMAWAGIDSADEAGMIEWLADSPEALLWGLANQYDRGPFTWPQVLDGGKVDESVTAEAIVIRLKVAERKSFRESLQGFTQGQQFGEVRKLIGRVLCEHCELDPQEAEDWLTGIALTDDHWVRLVNTQQSGKLLVTLSRREATDNFEQRLHEEKMASMKQLAYGASHEINNPLANIASRAQTLMMDEDDPGRRRRLAKINEQAFRAHEMIADMMLFAHPPKPDFTEVDPVQLVQTVVEEMQESAAEQQTVIQFLPQPVAGVQVDKTQLAVAVKALLRNSLESLQNAGTVEIEVQQLDVESRQILMITVADDGPGISPESIRHIFDPFYSGREAGRGLGFGLSKAWRIAELHGGEISAESTCHAGARFCLRIPYRDAI